MSKPKYYISTAIAYTSSRPHIGNTYEIVLADSIARYKRMEGYDVYFQTGTDEHGQKIEEKANAAGITPKEYVDNVAKIVKANWDVMNTSYDKFIRTTDDYHVKAIQRIFKRMYDKGDIYKGTYKGKYCTPCESFWTESQLKDGKCPDCGREVQDAEEEAYFFRLSKYADRVQDLLENTDFLEPRSRVNEMVNNFIKPGLEDLCVSRTSFSWGIPVDFDPGHVVYVWVDALFNYTTALGFLNDKYDDYEKYWPADVHFVGKEIVRFHSIIWPAMLMSMEMPLPKKVYGHGWLLLDGGKMSKSKGNVVDPYILAERFGVDALRFFLLRTFPFGSDGNFSNELLIQTINIDLANDLGNLVSRTNPEGAVTRMTYRNGAVASVKDPYGVVTRLAYDRFHNLTEASDSRGNTSLYGYDLLGRCVSVTNPKGAVQKREYDPVGRVVRVLDFDGNDIRLSYDGIDNLTEYHDNVQHVEYGYSGMWKLTRRRDHRGVVSFRYDREERLRRVTNERLQSYEFTLDAVGNVTAEKGFDGAVRRYLRDRGGRVVRETLPSGTEREYGYDACSRVTCVSYPTAGDPDQTYAYGLSGRLVQASRGESTVEFAYNSLGLPVRETADGNTILRTYDHTGRILTLDSTAGASLRYTRNGYGELEGFTATGGSDEAQRIVGIGTPPRYAGLRGGAHPSGRHCPLVRL